MRVIACCAVLLSSLMPCLAVSPVEDKARLREGQILRGRFVQDRHLRGFQSPLKSMGTFMLAPGLGLIWRTEQPFAITTVMSPAGLMQEVRGKETMRLPAAKLPFMSKLYATLDGALTGDWSALSSTFNVVRKPQADGWSLQLIPLKGDDPSLPIKSIQARGNKLLEEVEVLKSDGDRDRLLFLDQRIETTAPSAQEAVLLEAAAKQ
jgi:hypothetical protein